MDKSTAILTYHNQYGGIFLNTVFLHFLSVHFIVLHNLSHISNQKQYQYNGYDFKRNIHISSCTNPNIWQRT